MKTLLSLTLLLATATLVTAQPTPPALPAAPGTGARVSAAGPHATVWSRKVAELTPFGGTREVEHSYVQIQSGLNWLNAGAWVPAREEFAVYAGFCVATQAQHKVILAANLATAGAVDMELPDRTRVQSHLLGIALLDLASGKSILISEVKECVAVADGNQVVYPDAMTEFQVDVQYVNSKAGFSQNLILRERPPLPERFGLDSRTTVMQVLTEFIHPPPVTLRAECVLRADGTEAIGSEVDFGTFRLGRGTAFRWADGERGTEIPVRKAWQKLDNRDFLIEEIPLRDIADELDRLPLPTGAIPPPGTNAIPRTASLRFQLPPAPRTARVASQAPVLLARYTPPARAFVLDYQGLNSTLTNVTFQADTTYYVSGRVDLYGTNVFEGGTILKFADVSSAALWVNGPMQWDTGLYRPCVFTSKNDDALGESIAGSTGNPQRQQHVALVTAQSGTVRGARFLYARTALCPLASLVVEDVQWRDCGLAVDAYAQSVTLRNGLFVSVTTLVNGSLSGLTVTGEHLTGDVFGALVAMSTGCTLTALNLTNCLFTAGTNWVTGQANPTINTNAVTWLASSSGVYQTAGGGAYYLADGSQRRNAGTTNVSSSVRALVQARTTYPPLVLTGTTNSVTTTLYPQAQRDTDTPDQGYHYAPLDYAFGGARFDADVTVSAGTALGWFRTSSGWEHAGHGITLGDRTTLTFAGTVTAPAWWVRLTTVQEHDQTAGYGPGGITGWAAQFADAPRIVARFLRCATLANDALHFRDDYGWLSVAGRDCEFYNGGIAGYIARLHYTNCLLYRASVWLAGGLPDGDMAWRNCTFRGGSFTLDRWLSGGDPNLGQVMVSIRDCAFDGMTVNTADVMATNAAYHDYGWNAYNTNATQTTPAGTADLTGVAFNWQAGTLGAFYLPTNSVLVNAGSLTNAALAGLYHHTTQTNNVKEATNHLDIAYHYIACTNGVPVDTDGDGLPDYLEDANGNGVVDSAETHWNSASDLGLKVLILRPRAGSLGP